MQNSENPIYSGLCSLFEIDSNLPNYSRRIVGMLFAHSRINCLHSARVLDFGAGSGSLTEIWREVSGVAPDCVELDPTLRAILVRKGFNAVPNLASLAGNYDFIYSSNTLEHILNDDEILLQLTSLLTPGGIIGIYVPAFPMLFTDFDKSVGHFRRYRRHALIRKLEAAGTSVRYCSYSDSVGFFATAILKLIGFSFHQAPSTSKMMKIYDRCLLPISTVLDQVGFRFFLGKNLLIIARKK